MTKGGRRRPFHCVHCLKNFSFKSSLDRHVSVIHFGMRRYQCTVCAAKFGQKKQLKHHYSTRHSDFLIECLSNQQASHLFGGVIPRGSMVWDFKFGHNFLLLTASFGNVLGCHWYSSTIGFSFSCVRCCLECCRDNFSLIFFLILCIWVARHFIPQKISSQYIHTAMRW